jgi:hypothetical protein
MEKMSLCYQTGFCQGWVVVSKRYHARSPNYYRPTQVQILSESPLQAALPDPDKRYRPVLHLQTLLDVRTGWRNMESA